MMSQFLHREIVIDIHNITSTNFIFCGHLTNHELQISLTVKANLEAFTEIRNWAVLLLNISTLI